MKLTRSITLILFAVFYYTISLKISAQTLTLTECHELGQEESPLKRKALYLSTVNALRDQITNENNYPALQLQGSASYQSDVVSLPINVPGQSVPIIPKDQYYLSLNISQKLYDGGRLNATRLKNEAENQLKAVELEVSLYQIKEVINDLFFGILLIEQNQKVIESLNQELDNQVKKSESAFTNGILLASAVKSLQKEKIKAEQQALILGIKKSSLLAILGDWIGRELDSSTILVLPLNSVESMENARPELELFAYRTAVFSAGERLMVATNKPRILGFAVGGMGSPNPLNFFEATLGPYYRVGARLEWSLNIWGSTKRERQILSVQQQMVDSDREIFLKNIKTGTTSLRSKIKEIELMIEMDHELLDLQVEIMEEARRQFDQGVLSSSDYISELNEKTQVELQLNSHKIERQKLIVELLTLTGNI